MAHVFTYDIAIGDDMDIGNSFVVITECCIASYVSHFLDLLDTVGIQCVFVVNDCVETDNVSLFQSGVSHFLIKIRSPARKVGAMESDFTTRGV